MEPALVCIVKRLAEGYGGSVTIADGEGDGTTFIVTLPLA